MVVPFSV